MAILSAQGVFVMSAVSKMENQADLNHPAVVSIRAMRLL